MRATNVEAWSRGSRVQTLDLGPWILDLSCMLSVALTGNIGAGKSTVAELFRGWGATVIDADRLVRDAQTPGQPALSRIEARFGPEVIGPDGDLNRPRLRTIVASDPEALSALNAIMHPEVHRRRRELLAEAGQRGERIVISDIPLLFEAADPEEFDAVVLVDAPEEVRRRRVLESRSLPAAELEALMSAQLPSSFKRQHSDYVIDNAGDLPALERSAAAVWAALRARA